MILKYNSAPQIKTTKIGEQVLGKLGSRALDSWAPDSWALFSQAPDSWALDSWAIFFQLDFPLLLNPPITHVT